MIDNREELISLSSEAIANLCHRRFGIGADGLILITEAGGVDFGMAYYNADGRESTMCGNGGRCAVALADFLAHKEGPYHFIAIDGEHTGIILKRERNIHVIKLKMKDQEDWDIIEGDFIADTGSPHLVRFTEKDTDITGEGKAIRYLEKFQPGGINVNFVRMDNEGIFVRTYERGVEDETLSCGTGVTAASLALACKKNIVAGSIPVETRGGSLKVHFVRDGKAFRNIWLEGPAVRVFEGFVFI